LIGALRVVLPAVVDERHIVFVQYGDYRSAVERFAAGGGATYGSQHYSVQQVAAFARDARVTVISIPAPLGEKQLESGVLAVGLGNRRGRIPVTLLRYLERLSPTDIVLRTPVASVLSWARLRSRRVLPMLADSFPQPRLTQRFLATLLNNPAVPVVGNHNLPACSSLASLGVDAGKIVPWDWPQERTPQEQAAKERVHPGAPFHILFAGVVSAPKGTVELITAVSLLAREGIDARLVVAGSGEVEAMTTLARELGCAERVQFLGRIPNTRVFELMRESDVVVVPSRPTYAEGLPIVINEALCSRSPLVLSDHPIFVQALRDAPGIVFFEAGNAASLAQSLAGLARDAALYARVSAAAPAAWDRLQVPLRWGDIVRRWFHGSADDFAFLKAHALAHVPSARWAVPGRSTERAVRV